MKLMDYFRVKMKPTAGVAKERLQIIVAHERKDRSQPDYLADLQKDIVAVIRKYVSIHNDDVSVSLDQHGHCSILELNVTLPEAEPDVMKRPALHS